MAAKKKTASKPRSAAELAAAGEWFSPFVMEDAHGLIVRSSRFTDRKTAESVAKSLAVEYAKAYDTKVVKESSRSRPGEYAY